MQLTCLINNIMVVIKPVLTPSASSAAAWSADSSTKDFLPCDQGLSQDIKRQHPPQPQSVHSAAVWQKMQKYLLPCYQTTERLHSQTDLVPCKISSLLSFCFISKFTFGNAVILKQIKIFF